MSILEDLWYGQLCPISDTDCRDGEYRHLITLWENNEKKLLATLSQQQREEFEKLKDLWDEMDRMSQCAAFVTGFRLAVQIMAASV